MKRLLPLYKFGEKNVETEIPVTEAELDMKTYIRLPKPGINPRGVEMIGTAMGLLINNPNTMQILINRRKEPIDFKPFARWVELWQMD